MSQRIPIYIPTFINAADYSPARVLPHIYFYNGLLDCETYYIESGSLTNSGVTYAQNQFPYFDNYNVITGQFPTTGSISLLFNNEAASYGEIPNESLYNVYWETYVSLLYNPKTRLLNASAIIPLADYFKMELNDVVNFKGNYYHLRAINDYSLKTGECNLQLLGPIIQDTFSAEYPEPPAPPLPPATASIKLSEYNASPGTFLDANLFVSGTAYYFSGDFTQSVGAGDTGNVTFEFKDTSPTFWGQYKTGSASLIIRDNGSLVTSSVTTYYSGSGDQSITVPITFTSGHNYQITGSTTVTGSLTPIPLNWSFSEFGGARGTMNLMVNSSIVVSRSIDSTGTVNVNVGDTISVEITCDECGGNTSNAYCTGIINEGECIPGGPAYIMTGNYTVQNSDIGDTLTLDNYAACSIFCLSPS